MQMRLLLINITILFSLQCFSQYTSGKKIPQHELYLVLYSRSFWPQSPVFIKDSVWKEGSLNGIIYKKSLPGQLNFRASIQFFTENSTTSYVEERGSPVYYSITTAEIKSYDLTVGIEKEFLKGRLQPYLFTDIITHDYRVSSNSQGVSAPGCFGGGGPFNRNWDYRTTKLGVCFGAGLRLALNEHFALAAETGAEAFLTLFLGDIFSPIPKPAYYPVKALIICYAF